jgi:hypothetical protein
MDPKMIAAKKNALMSMRKGMRDKSLSPLGEEFKKSPKMMKVTVSAPDEEGLEEGISKAQKILAAKFGQMDPSEMAHEMSEDEGEGEEGYGDTKSSDIDSMLGEKESEDMVECPECEGHGCEMCL